MYRNDVQQYVSYFEKAKVLHNTYNNSKLQIKVDTDYKHAYEICYYSLPKMAL